MTLIGRSSSYEEIENEFKNRHIPVSSNIIDLIKDLFEDNPDIVLSYKGIQISFDSNLVFSDSFEDSLVIYTELTEEDVDNLKIHGVEFKTTGSVVTVETPNYVESNIEPEFRTTHIW